VPQKIGVAVVVGLLLSSPAFAQSYEKGWIDVNFGSAQSSQKDFTSAFTVELFSETGGLAAAYPKPNRGADFDFGGGFMFNPVFGIGLSVSGTAHEDPAGLAVTVPHPFFFDASTTASDITGDVLKRTEGAYHIQLAAVPLRTDRLVIRLFGGPSYFRVRQDLVSDISYVQVAPLFSRANDVTVTGWDGNSEVAGSGWGFNAGADLGVFFTRVVGIGAVVRFTQANVDLADPLSETNVTMKAGGLQVGGGIRLKF
jgi:outer membrane protein with beta-barrel domain